MAAKPDYSAILHGDRSHSPHGQANLSYIIISNNYFNNHHLPQYQVFPHVSLHPFTENFLETPIYTASSLFCIFSFTEIPLAKVLTLCRPCLILQIHKRASSKLGFPNFTRRDFDFIDLRWGLGISQPYSNWSDVENAKAGLSPPLCGMMGLMTPFYLWAPPWLRFRGSTLSSVSIFMIWTFSSSLEGSFLLYH